MESLLWATGFGLAPPTFSQREHRSSQGMHWRLATYGPLPVTGNSETIPKIHWCLYGLWHPIAQVFGIGAHY